MADQNDRSTDVSIHNEATDVAVTTTTDGAKERLDVDASITGEVTISSSVPRWDWDVIKHNLTSGVDFSLFTTGTGVTGFIDFIQVLAKNSSYETALIIDGIEELRISQADLGTMGLLSSNSTGIPLYAASASKIFSVHPNQPFHFSDSFELIVQSSSAGNSIDGHMITWREQI